MRPQHKHFESHGNRHAVRCLHAGSEGHDGHEADGRRQAAEAFIRAVFHRRYGAQVPAVAPNLMLLEQDGDILAAAGWRAAGRGQLMLEDYLDQPVEELVGRLAGHGLQSVLLREAGRDWQVAEIAPLYSGALPCEGEAVRRRRRLAFVGVR